MNQIFHSIKNKALSINAVSRMLKIRARPEYLDLAGLKSVCPKCHGTGDIKHKTYRMLCTQCYGWGWVKDEDLHCIHEWQESDLGHFMNEWKCKKCGRVRMVDSSG